MSYVPLLVVLACDFILVCQWLSYLYVLVVLASDYIIG